MQPHPFYEAAMPTRLAKKLIREGDYLAEVEVTLIDDDSRGVGWAPYLSVEDVQKLDAVRLALQAGDLRGAARYGQVFRLEPLTP